MGLENRVLPAGEVMAFALGQARRIASLATGSVILSKRLMKDSTGAGSEEVIAHMNKEIEVFCARLQGPAAREAFVAFKAKRKPSFAGLE